MQRIAIFCCVITVALAVGTASAKQRHALLIGNQAYAQEVGRLRNPTNDVNLIAEALSKVGFKKQNIRIVEDADRIALLDAIDTYVDTLSKAGRDAVGFFYYSGHGAANKRDRRNYLIPVGVKRLDRRVWFKAIALNDIVTKLSELASNAAHFVVFDACRNLLNAPTRGGKGFLPIATRRGMLIAFSTDPGETASDEGSNSGPYAAALAAELTKNGQDHLDLFQNVKERVYRTTRAQVPWTRDGMLQRIYLGGKGVAPPKPLGPTFSQQAELAFWNSVKDSKDTALLQTYLKTYPNGTFAPVARILSDRLRKSAEKEALALMKQEQLRAAKEKERLAKLARDLTESKARQQRQSTELAKARAEAKSAREALRLAEQQRTEAARAAKEAHLQNDRAKREAEQATKLKVAALTNAASTDTIRSAEGAAGQTPGDLAGLNPLDLAKRVQTELQRLGCLNGSVDGIWGGGSRKALASFNSHAGMKLETTKPTKEMLSVLTLQKQNVCPAKINTPKSADNKRKKPISRTKSTNAKQKSATVSGGKACRQWKICAGRYAVPYQHCGWRPKGC